MSKKNLFTPLSIFMRKRLTSIPPDFPFNSSQFKCSTSLLSPAPSITPYDRLLHEPSRYFGNVRVSIRSVCSASSQKIESRCWNCHAIPESAPFLVCQSCRSIQPVDKSIDYFDIFGLEKNYDIEVKNLEGEYKNWQKKIHPDLVHSKSEKERDFAAEQSAKVIDAYRTLTRPLSRAIYLLKLEGIEVDDEQTVSDPELLAEILEIREAVEDAADSEALNHIRSEMQEKLKHWSNVFADAFQSRNFEEAKSSIQRMTYYERVTDEVAKKL
ncbi:iron-sulfur cluster co-chaperone protein HscB homolog [Neltuma alba]|uniref:iron-sulfur cluster co-chaperone protein HscB homolog n=1 Tax=Neltuma alba TaxID=207710 RepID=UPI0010A43093|nr:iron-sulfur cluster co-chaperone protein HscB homolog [Prosopis alba]XP_028784883.1 iron-sulfur cluster co-chaperone protein HscB homolog [Prosopis alba]